MSTDRERAAEPVEGLPLGAALSSTDGAPDSAQVGGVGLCQAHSKQVVRSVVWRVLEIIGSEGLSFLFFIGMARLLVPEDFGMVALAGSVLQVALGVLQRGLPEALIQAPQLNEDQTRNAIRISVLAGALLMLVMIALAWPLGWLLERDTLPPVLLALAPLTILQGLAMPLHALLRRQIDFRRIALRTVLATLSGGLIAIGLAIYGAGAWALVAQQWVVSIVGVLVLWRGTALRCWPFRVQLDPIRGLLNVARPILIGGLLTNASRRLDTVVLALFVTDHEVGLYFLIARLIQSVQMITTHSISEIGLSVLARLQDQPDRLASAIGRTFRLTIFVTLLCFGGLIIEGNALVPAVFGMDWLDAVRPLQAFAALSGFAALTTVAIQVLVAIGAAQEAGRMSAWGAVVQVVALFVGAPWGLMAMVLAVGLFQTLLLWPALGRIARYASVRRRHVLASLPEVLGAWLLALAVGLVIGDVFEALSWSYVLTGAAYMAVMLAFGYRWRHSMLGETR